MRFKLLLFLFLVGCSATPTAAKSEITEPAPEYVPPEGPQELLVTSLGVWTDDVLLYEERAVLAEALIQRINTGDIGAFTAERYAVAKARWDGFLRGEYPNGKQCTDVPSPNATDRALQPEAPELDARIDCKEGCRLRVTVYDRDENQNKLADLLLDLPQDQNQWANAIHQNSFKPYPKSKGAGGLGIGGYNAFDLNEPKISLKFAQLSPNWNIETKQLTPLFQPHVDKFLACGDSNKQIWRDWWANNHILQVDATGRVTNCEQAIEDHLPRPTFACFCNVIESSVNFGPGDQNRRLRTQIDILMPKRANDGMSPAPNNDGLRRSAWLNSSEASGDDPLSKAIGVNALAYNAFQACFKHLPGREMEVEVPVEFVIDAQGTTESVAAQWPGAIPPDFAQCATPILKTADFACPMNKTATLQTTLKVSVYK